MKTATYRNIEMTIKSTSSYGRYEISATIRGKVVTTYTTDAEIYDYFDCDYYDKNDKNFARRSAYNELQDAAKG